MKTTIHDKNRRGRREFPEMQVGFPERNDASNPNEEMERVHVDLETLDISRKNAGQVDREIKEEDPAANAKETREKKKSD